MLKGLRALTPYQPGDQPAFSDMIKLNTNEHPLPPSPKVAAVLANYQPAKLRRYPSLDQADLTAVLAQANGVKPEQIIVGNGSDEILAFAMLAFFNDPTVPLLFPDITYGFYQVWAELFQIPYQEVPLRSDFTLDFADYDQPNGGILFPNPNAPTGLAKDLTALASLAKHHAERVIVVDEAYYGFGCPSAVALLPEHPNLVITRTFSKSHSLAGQRVGYAIASVELIQLLKAVKFSFNPYSVDDLAEKVATAATEDHNYYQAANAQVQEVRQTTAATLIEYGFRVVPSQTNFLFVEHPTIPAATLYAALADAHIYVRYFKDAPRIANYLRISIGTAAEMKRCLETIKTLVSTIQPS